MSTTRWRSRRLLRVRAYANWTDRTGAAWFRVIIPLLVLHWAFHCNGTSIPRINILPQLLTEACDFLHQRLTASIFNLRMFGLPFSRDIQVDSQVVVAMQSLLNLCRSSSGFVVVAPEHRLSLELKIKELEVIDNRSELAAALRTVHDFSWTDVLDESDELLHHRFQLIYAEGSVQELPAGSHRWRAAQSLLSVMHGDHETLQWIEGHKHFVSQAKEVNREVFRPVQVTSQITSLIPDFHSVLAHAVVASPPHEMEWIKGHARHESILASLLDERAPADCIEDLDEAQRNDVLALRGLLVGGILVHCLQKRHRVDFGVARPGKKKLSVPFRGADTPSLR